MEVEDLGEQAGEANIWKSGSACWTQLRGVQMG